MAECYSTVNAHNAFTSVDDVKEAAKFENTQAIWLSFSHNNPMLTSTKENTNMKQNVIKKQYTMKLKTILWNHFFPPHLPISTKPNRANVKPFRREKKLKSLYVWCSRFVEVFISFYFPNFIIVFYFADVVSPSILVYFFISRQVSI